MTAIQAGRRASIAIGRNGPRGGGQGVDEWVLPTLAQAGEKQGDVVQRRAEQLGLAPGLRAAGAGVANGAHAHAPAQPSPNAPRLLDEFAVHGHDLRGLVQQLRAVGRQTHAARRALIEQAQAIYAEELPSFYLYSPLWATASNARFRPWFTPGGFAFGVLLPLNKLMFTQ